MRTSANTRVHGKPSVAEIEGGQLDQIARAVRIAIIRMTTAAGSGHPSSCLSAVEIGVSLFFGGSYRYDIRRPEKANNDRFLLSKGHAAPLLYALYAIAGGLSDRALLGLRKFQSPLEGHPTRRFKHIDVPTGSLGQGLSVGVGMAEASRISRLGFRTWVLLGDAELSEGQVWEAAALAGRRKTGHLTAIVDLNGLGQSGPPLFSGKPAEIGRMWSNLGWQTMLVDGHDNKALVRMFRRASEITTRPSVIIASTVKGKGIPQMEGRQGWHGRVLTRKESATVIRDLRSDRTLFDRPRIELPARIRLEKVSGKIGKEKPFEIDRQAAPRTAFGFALNRMSGKYPRIIVIDGDVKNSTGTELFFKKQPRHSIQAYIAEQNMVGLASGLAARGFQPVAATFAAFWTRAHDQLRMAAYSGQTLLMVGTHAGTAVGPDGPSQMGLEDVALFRSLFGTTVLAASDAVSADRLTELGVRTPGLTYLRLTRNALAPIYPVSKRFVVGGSHVIRQSRNDVATVLANGSVLQEAVAAAEILARKGKSLRVVDVYSIKPIDRETLLRAGRETGVLVVVEDHVPEGGLGDAVAEVIGDRAKLIRLAVSRVPRSGTPRELFRFERIDAQTIVECIMRIRK